MAIANRVATAGRLPCRGVLRAGLVPLLLCLLIAACAELPAHPPAVPPAAAGELARQVAVTGPAGAVSPAAEAHTLAEMEALFRLDREAALAIDPLQWQQRGWRDRALQQLGRWLERWL